MYLSTILTSHDTLWFLKLKPDLDAFAVRCFLQRHGRVLLLRTSEGRVAGATPPLVFRTSGELMLNKMPCLLMLNKMPCLMPWLLILRMLIHQKFEASTRADDANDFIFGNLPTMIGRPNFGVARWAGGLSESGRSYLEEID